MYQINIKFRIAGNILADVEIWRKGALIVIFTTGISPIIYGVDSVSLDYAGGRLIIRAPVMAQAFNNNYICALSYNFKYAVRKGRYIYFGDYFRLRPCGGDIEL